MRSGSGDPGCAGRRGRRRLCAGAGRCAGRVGPGNHPDGRDPHDRNRRRGALRCPGSGAARSARTIGLDTELCQAICEPGCSGLPGRPPICGRSHAPQVPRRRALVPLGALVEIFRNTAELQARADAARALGERIALVPTMGALHAGHRALMDAGRARAQRVCVSIFVNPTQFNSATDLAAYPRTWEADLEACREAGVHWVYAPEPGDLYPDGFQTWVDVSELSEPLCGAARPGHFRGVATVVCKLFLAAKPHVAVFGEKDQQQLAVVRRMTRDLGFDLEIVGVPTVREADGLALSSRNVHLAGEARSQATVLVRALDAAEAAVLAGETSADALLEIAHGELANAPLAEIDYAELRGPRDLELLCGPLDDAALLALAVFFPRASGAGDRVRLIDNRVLPKPLPQEER
ncbi:MAG: pantoate--beta-alanine ligase [bacterium]|nr:pantoate--beta-alanine ligase [bacterium]